MSSREEILSRLRHNTRETFDMPDLAALTPITFADPVAEFIHKTTTTAGATLIEMQPTDRLDDLIRRAYPEARSVASNLPGVRTDVNPDTVAEAQELMHVDVGVVQGCIGVAENACIWIPQQTKEKAVCFAVQQLVILLPRDAIVSNMHQAYALIQTSTDYFSRYPFGTFISGPSKTADIESALVYGAQAARAVTVILTPP
ncbi:MAG: LUD domain-containing protein [Bacteroidaceae bacterium]|nr:LUD domain-containing protein [Bacteroidaceae bacterium]